MSSRKLFEAAMSASPFERSVVRFGTDESKFAWAGQYRDKEGAKEAEALRAALREFGGNARI